MRDQDWFYGTMKSQIGLSVARSESRDLGSAEQKWRDPRKTETQARLPRSPKNVDKALFHVQTYLDTPRKTWGGTSCMCLCVLWSVEFRCSHRLVGTWRNMQTIKWQLVARVDLRRFRMRRQRIYLSLDGMQVNLWLALHRVHTNWHNLAACFLKNSHASAAVDTSQQSGSRD